MIVVKLQGGLGNQMFQYAMGKAMAKLHDSSFELDLDFLLDRTPHASKGFVFRDYDLDVFAITPAIAAAGQERKYSQPTFLEKVISGFQSKTFYKERFFQYDAQALQCPPNIYLDGYWQSAHYFKVVEKELRADFTFVNSIASASKKLHEDILHTDSICVNVRRADFLTNSYHGVCGMSYFEPAIQHLASSLTNPKVFVFSDDPQWCLTHFKSKFSLEVVDHTHKGFKFSNQLQLMAACKHFIIPNSTFAWWAVWLSNKKESKVIAPTHWFADESIDTTDLIPENWMRFTN
jgi:Glycosyl transferase family 11